MKISFLGLPGNWLLNLIPELINLRHEILFNECNEDCDVILATDRNQWEGIKAIHEKYPKIPLICWNWDWYDYLKDKDGKFIDTRMFGRGTCFNEFAKLMKESLEVWTSSKAEALKCEKDTGIKSDFFFYAFIFPWEWEGENRDWGYIIQASRQDPNKRFDWYERAVDELGIPFKSYHPNINTRPDYIRTIKNCSFIVSASREESLGGLTCYEAAYCRKPILIGDCDGNKEVWEKDVTYFKRDDYEDFKKQMKWLWENYKSKEVQDKVERAYKKVSTRFVPKYMAKIINERLNEKIKGR